MATKRSGFGSVRVIPSSGSGLVELVAQGPEHLQFDGMHWEVAEKNGFYSPFAYAA